MVVGEPTVGEWVTVVAIESIVAVIRVRVIQGRGSQSNCCCYGGDIGFSGDGLGGWNGWYLWSDWQVIAGGTIAVFVGHVVEGERLSFGVGEA